MAAKHTLTDGFYQVPIVDLGSRLRDNFGLDVGEHSAFGGVAPVHAPNSYHKYDEAIDVRDWRDDNLGGVHWTQRTKNLEQLLQGSGPEVIGPGSGVEGHDTHLHLAAKDGMFKLTPNQYGYLFGGQAGGKDSTFGFDPDKDYSGMFGPQVTPADGTDPDTKAQQGLTEAVTRIRNAKEAVDSFGNDFGSMKSSRLGAALSGAQESIIQGRMDAGEQFGTITEQKPITKDEGSNDTPDPPSGNPTKSRITQSIKDSKDE